jgi:arsenate reductase
VPEAIRREEFTPAALKQLEASHLSTAGLCSKSWNEFELPSAPQLDLILTVCDKAAKELCPVWPGHSITAHWGMPDPAAERTSAEATEKAFSDAFRTLERRIVLLLNLPLSRFDGAALKRELNNIGRQ